MAMTLDELKAENAAKEAEEAAATDENATEDTEDSDAPQADDETENTEAVDEELEDTTEDAESEEEETGDTETEDWKQGDSHESQVEKKYTGTDIGAAKAKVKAKLERKLDAKDGEIDRLKAELEQARGSKPTDLVRPKREDFFDVEDPDEAFTDALTDYKIKKFEAESTAKNQALQTTQQQQKILQDTSDKVDQHYERAAVLSEKSGISPELYQSADLTVRQMVDSIFPDAGDAVTDGLIARLGQGSEKVMYNIGINSSRREELKNLLLNDKTGIQAAVYLGELKSELNGAHKRKTTAPKPASKANGDKVTISMGALKKKWEKAHSDGKFQDAFNLKQQAKKGGADVSNW